MSLLLVLCVLAIASIWGQSKGKPSTRLGDWPSYAADLASTRYSPLDQINAANFGQLEVAWRFKDDNFGRSPDYNFQATPLAVNGVLYLPAGMRRTVVAIDGATGEVLWTYSLNEGKRGEGATQSPVGRGVAYWTDGTDERILNVTPGYQLVALDAKTGRPVQSFGRNGIVDLKTDLDQPVDLETGDITWRSAPVVGNDVVVIGAAHARGSNPKSRSNVTGNIRGFDVRTGKRLWIFHTIPRPGELGNDTWLKDSWAITGNTGLWGTLSIDEENGLAYLPIEMPTNDIYGGHRPGAGLFGESLVAVDLKTGRRKWHFQTTHHGLWDYDLPCAPILADLTINGTPTRVVAQCSKQAWFYTFDRITGKPIWPIEEHPVPGGVVPGEWYSPTQPFPTKPPAFDRQTLSTDDLIDFTPEIRDEALKVAGRYKLGPIYEPPSLSTKEGSLGTLTLPGAGGGANWPGAAFDPETKTLYVYSSTAVGLRAVVPVNPAVSDVTYAFGTAETGPVAVGAPGFGGPSVLGLPLIKPPWGRITATNLATGEITWQVPHGETPDGVRNHPKLKGVNIPRTGRSGHAGVLVTKTLVISGESGTFTLPTGQRGAMLRAYDKATGQEMGAVYMPAGESGSPMTYLANRRQYVAIAVSGGNHSGELIAFRLPAQ